MVVQANVPGTTFGKTTIGALTHALGGNYLEASGRYTLASSSSVTKLSAYLQGGGSATSVRAVIYTDSGSQPGAFVAVSQPVTIAAGQAAGWVDFPVSGLADAARGPVLARVVGLEHERPGLLRQQLEQRPLCALDLLGGQQSAGELAGRRQLRLAVLLAVRDLGHAAERTGEHCAAGDLRVRDPGAAAELHDRDLVEQPDRLCVPVAPLRRGRGGLRGYRRCDQLDLHAGCCRCVGHGEGGGDGDERGRFGSATSTPTTAVASTPAPANTAPPAITGTATEGQALTATNGTWTDTPTSSPTSGSAATTRARTAATSRGATNSAYTLVSADVGTTIKAMVTATNTSGSTQATSDPDRGRAGAAADVVREDIGRRFDACAGR